VRGWELVVTGAKPDVLASLSHIFTRRTEISPGRYALELSLDHPPEQVLSSLIASGASLISLNPIRDTLEDFFVRRVAEAGPRESNAVGPTAQIPRSGVG